MFSLLSFYFVVSPPETADLFGWLVGLLVCLDVEESDAQLAHVGSSEKKREASSRK